MTFSRSILITATCLLAGTALAQLSLPQIVQLPTEDFTYVWGQSNAVDERERPDFQIRGDEVPFSCELTGSFRPGSRMRDFYNMREFEQAMMQSIYFIQTATSALNNLFLSNDLDWAVMECIIPESSESEDEAQERVDKALERALRDRERRRERQERENN